MLLRIYQHCVSKLHQRGFYTRCMFYCRHFACWRIKSEAFTYLPICVSKLHAYNKSLNPRLFLMVTTRRRLACWRTKSEAFTYLPICVSKLHAYNKSLNPPLFLMFTTRRRLACWRNKSVAFTYLPLTYLNFNFTT